MHESESNALVATNWWWRKGHKSLQMSMDIRLFNVFNAGFHFVDTEAAQGPSESVKPGCGDIVLLAVVPATTLQIVATCVSTLIVLDVATLDTVLTVEMQYVTNVMSYGTVAANGDGLHEKSMRRMWNVFAKQCAPTIVGSARLAKNLERVPSAMESFVPNALKM